jgi:hypothetical protein
VAQKMYIHFNKRINNKKRKKGKTPKKKENLFIIVKYPSPDKSTSKINFHKAISILL